MPETRSRQVSSPSYEAAPVPGRTRHSEFYLHLLAGKPYVTIEFLASDGRWKYKALKPVSDEFLLASKDRWIEWGKQNFGGVRAVRAKSGPAGGQKVVFAWVDDDFYRRRGVLPPFEHFAQKQSEPSEPLEIEGVLVYPVDAGTYRWAVQSPENKKTGEGYGLGDTLWRTFPEAEQYAREMAGRERARAAVRKAQADEAARQAAAKASDDLNGFVDGMSPMQKGRVEKALSKLYRFSNGEVMSVRQRIECLHAEGKLELDAFEEPRIKPMSRRCFNNATLAEQRAHEEKMRKAGNKTTYLVSGSDLGKVAHDYARHLISTGKPDVGTAPRIVAGPAI